MFDNGTGLHILDEWAFSPYALWLVNAHGAVDSAFYIIPPVDAGAEIEGGPDNQLLDALNALCRDHGMPTEEEIEALGLEIVSFALWRFSPHDGYYHA